MNHGKSIKQVHQAFISPHTASHCDHITIHPGVVVVKETTKDFQMKILDRVYGILIPYFQKGKMHGHVFHCILLGREITYRSQMRLFTKSEKCFEMIEQFSITWGNMDKCHPTCLAFT